MLDVVAIYRTLCSTLENAYISQAHMSNSPSQPCMRSQNKAQSIMKKQDVEKVYDVLLTIILAGKSITSDMQTTPPLWQKVKRS